MKQYCHFTNDEGAEKIISSGRIQASLMSRGDAASGAGVYLTKLMPRSSTRDQVALNNWGSTDDQYLRKTKNIFVLELPDNKVEDVSTNDRNIFLFGGFKDLRLVKYKWYLQDFDTGKILASYRYHIESTGPFTAASHFNQEDYVMTEKTRNGRPVYKLKTGPLPDRFVYTFVRLFGCFPPEHDAKYLFMTRYGNWKVGRNADSDLGYLRQKAKYSLGPSAAGAWEYHTLCWKGDDPTLKSYPWYACSRSEWKTTNTLVTPAATTALTTVTTSSPATAASSLATPAATISSTTAIIPLPPPLMKPPPLSPTHLPSSPTPLNLPSTDTMKRSMSLPSLPKDSSQDGIGLHSQDQSARMISLISEIPSGGIPQDSAPGTPGGSNYNTTEGASPQSSTPVAEPSVSTPAVKPVEEKGPSGGQTIKQITLKSHHPSLKERQNGIIAALYGGQDMQCKSCGLRYSTDEMAAYTSHLNWQCFKIKRREKDNARKAQSRRWYFQKVDWIVCEDIEDEDADLTEEDLQEEEFEGEDDEKNVSSNSMDKTHVCDGAGEGASITQHRKTTAFSDDDNSPDGAVGFPVSSQLGEMATEFRDEVMQLLRLGKVTKALTLNK